MLPLAGFLFIPTLVVTPPALVTLFLWRRRGGVYPRVWRSALIVCFMLCGLFLYQVLSTPLYSQRDSSPNFPGGISGSGYALLVLLAFETCVVIPAFPVLIGLACLPPHGWPVRSRLLLAAFCLLFVGALAGLIARKNAILLADYRQAMQQEQSPFDRFQYLRRP